MNSQQNTRVSGGEGYGRPITKHQQRARVSNSQGGNRNKVRSKQPIGVLSGTQSANNQ